MSELSCEGKELTYNMETEETAGTEAKRSEGVACPEGEVERPAGAGSHPTCRPLEGI